MIHRRARRPARTARRPVGQAGFTIIELLIGLLISSLLIGMVFAIVLRMSVSYRTQQQVSETQQVLSSALALIRTDVKMAGLGAPNGFADASVTSGNIATTANVGYLAPVQLINGGGSVPDELRVYWADTTRAARVMPNLSATPGFDMGVPAVIRVLRVDDPSDFAAGDVVVITTPHYEDQSATPVALQTKIAVFRACTARVQTVNANEIELAVSGPFARPDNAQCLHVRTQHIADGAESTTMIYRAQARAYRVDATREVLQRSPSGGLIATDWQDIGVGFTDLQVAGRYYEAWVPAGVNDADSDGIPEYDWYGDTSGMPITLPWPYPTETPPGEPEQRFGPFAQPMEVVVSLVVRTQKTVEGVGTGATPDLVGNQLGDHPSEPLTGSHIYRHATARIDLRNMAVAR
ncbi:MAG: prepilin-type N-terminal cleavage/methylation domain-containing protein [Kofleriaceae bacterium]